MSKEQNTYHAVSTLYQVLHDFIKNLNLSAAQVDSMLKTRIDEQYHVSFYSDADRAIYLANAKVTLFDPNLSWNDLLYFSGAFGFDVHLSFYRKDVAKTNKTSEDVMAKVDEKKVPAGRKNKQALKNVLDLKIVDTSLNHRVSALLYSKKIDYVGQLAQMSIDSLYQLSGMGEKSVTQVCDMLHEFGLVLNSVFPEWKVPSEEEKANNGTGQTIYDKTLLEAGFVTSVADVLNKKGFHYIGDLVKHTREELEKKGIARVFVDVIIQKLNRADITLGTDLKGWKPPVKKTNSK